MGNRFEGTRLSVLMEHDELEQSGFVLGTEVSPQALLTGSAGDDTLIGGGGKDTLDGGLGADKMKGRGGNDTYIVDNNGDVVVEKADKGVDTVLSSVSYTLGSNIENLTLNGTGSLTGIGNALDNVIEGYSQHSVLYGLEGNDQITGGAAADRLFGGLGDDVLTGGGAYDTMDGGEGNDTLTARTGDFTGGAGDDLLLNTGGGGTMWGNEGNDTIVGGFAANRVVFGGAGDDFIDGGGGEGSLRGDDGDDILLGGVDQDYLRGGPGDDTVVGGSAGPLGARSADEMTGDDGNDLLSGGGGEDLLTGGPGADTFNFDSLGGLVWDLESGIDKVNVSQLTLPVGDGDEEIDGATVVEGPGGFAPTSELVIISRALPGQLSTSEAAAAIGSATGAYLEGQTAVFVVRNDDESTLFYFQSSNADAVVSANELSKIATLFMPNASATQVSDYRFDNLVLPQPYSPEAVAYTPTSLELVRMLMGQSSAGVIDDFAGF